MPIPYCTAEDVSLKLDKPPDRIQSDRRESYLTRAESASQTWDTETGTPMREVRVGSPESKPTWEQHRAREAAGSAPPIRVSLNHGNVSPIDPDKGDAVEIRVGRDRYRDITDELGNRFVVDNDRGEIRVFRFLYNRLYWDHPSERFLRITYRHGGLGGSRDRGYGTELADPLGVEDTEVSVDDASRFPKPPFRALVGTTSDLESVRVTAIDYESDTLTVERGVKYTEPIEHDAGGRVNYTPENVREAVAAKAAELLVINDDADLSVPDNGQLSSRRERAEAFAEEYDRAASKQAGVRTI